MISRDVLKGATKVKNVMKHTLYCCRACGLSHQHKRQAEACCKKVKSFNKNQHIFAKVMNAITNKGA